GRSRRASGRPGVADKPRLLVIEHDRPEGQPARERLSTLYEVVVARGMARALSLLREQSFAGVYVDSDQLPDVEWAGILLQAVEVLDAIADGVAVVDLKTRVLWANPEFQLLSDAPIEPGVQTFDEALGRPELLSEAPGPFATAQATRKPA